MGYCPETIVNVIETKFATAAAAAIAFNVNPGLVSYQIPLIVEIKLKYMKVICFMKAKTMVACVLAEMQK